MATKVLVLGMHGKLGRVVAKCLAEDSRYQVLKFTTGRKKRFFDLSPRLSYIWAYPPEVLSEDLSQLLYHQGIKDPSEVFVIDCSKDVQCSSAGKFAARHGLPLLMLGTTGIGDSNNEDQLTEMAEKCGDGFLLLRCTNALKPFIALMKALESIPDVTPGAFDGLDFFGEESHQRQKGNEVAGTLKRFAAAFERGGARIVRIKCERDPNRQVKIWHVPIRFLNGHAYHYFVVKCADFGFSIRTWVKGRTAYARYVRDDILPHLISLKEARESGIHVR